MGAGGGETCLLKVEACYCEGVEASLRPCTTDADGELLRKAKFELSSKSSSKGLTPAGTRADAGPDADAPRKKSQRSSEKSQQQLALETKRP